jgi:hypothetical protein
LEAGSTAIEELAAAHGIVDVGVRVPLDVSTLKVSICAVIFGGVPLNVTLYKNSGVAGGGDVCVPVEDPQLDKIGRPIRTASLQIRPPLLAINRLHCRKFSQQFYTYLAPRRELDPQNGNFGNYNGNALVLRGS